MQTESLEVAAIIPATPEQIFHAWLDSAEHSAMTGGEAQTTSQLGGTFTAWGGYISGKNLELQPGRLIVQSWRTSEFPQGAPESRLEISLEPLSQGTRVTIKHSQIPEGQGGQYRGGWSSRYLEPMAKYFAQRGKPGAGA